MFTQLTRHDPDENMNRWYTVIVQPTLLDPVAIITAWGSRENDYQQVHIEPVESLQIAMETAEGIVQAKLRRGYHIDENGCVDGRCLNCYMLALT
jgi:predicted DNA-binding WGR domain protein